MPKAGIYTRKGDRGETGFLGEKRVRKDDVQVEAVGTIDELNCNLGLACAQIEESRLGMGDRKVLKGRLSKVQSDLFVIGSLIGGYKPSEERRKKIMEGLGKQVVEMEKEMDQIENELPKLDNFILPGGSMVGAQLHVARGVCRRAERRVVALSSGEQPEFSLPYLNRLSDYLFTLARWVNFNSGTEEVVWRNN